MSTQRTAGSTSRVRSLAKTHAVATETPEEVPMSDRLHLALPPSDAKIPAPPAGFTPVASRGDGSILPRALELESLPGAVDELTKFADYDATLGKTVASHTQAVQLFDAANQWSTMRSAAAQWDAYSAAQEGVLWRGRCERRSPVSSRPSPSPLPAMRHSP